jgi:hypothetical protein
MRDDKRGPGLRGNTLVDAGDPAATGTAHAPDQDAADAEPTPGPETFDGTIRPDAGSHATGPNPIVTAADVRAEATGPNPILRAATEAEPGPDSKAGPDTGARPDTEADTAPDAHADTGTPGRTETADQPDEADRHTGADQSAATSRPDEADEPDAAREPDEVFRPGQSGQPSASDQPGRSGQPSGVVEPARPADPVPASLRLPEMYRPPRDPVPEPSWGKVLATTVSLWASRRFGRNGSQAGNPGPVAVYGATDTAAPSAPSSRWAGVRWPLVVFVLLLVILALVGLQLSGKLSGSGSNQPTAKSGGNAGDGGSLSAAEAARSQAATWMTQQVTASDVIACDPLMCSTLQADGVAGSRLMAVQPTTPDPLGADVVAATSTIRSQFGSRLVSEYAPELIASFGTGASKIDIRAVANYGAAAFEAKEQADLAARKSAGAQLLKNNFHVTTQGAGQIRAGQVDSRVLVTLAALLSQRPLQVSSFGDTGPGAPVLYRQVTLVNAPGQTGTSALNADLKQVKTQSSSFLPAQAQIVHLANGQSALRIEFGAPDQPGLLSGGTA